jgi:hypothetical protein
VSDHVLSSSSILSILFLIYVLLAKIDSSFDADGPKDARSEDKTSDFEAYLLGKYASESYQTRDEFYNYGRTTPKDLVTTRFQYDRVMG